MIIICSCKSLWYSKASIRYETIYCMIKENDGSYLKFFCPVINDVHGQ